jgi:polyhydroxybutyrate depolymerase
VVGVAGAGGMDGLAGAAGSAGSGGMDPGGGMYTVPRGKSTGCGKNPPGGDNPNGFTKHDIAVTGVDPAFIAEHPSNPGNNGGYTYTMRNYYVKLPANYDPGTAYPVTFGGGGCGNTGGDSGKGGGQQASNIDSIKIGLSYVYSGGACFEDGYANTPEVPYFDAVIKEISANYCVNLEKVFAGGYSSGAWESATLGLARGGVIRGIATGAGGLRAERPMPSNVPIAAILLTGQGDGANPIDGPTGSAALRDHILMKNGCQGTATTPFTASDQNCVQYTGCPAAFPVIWCTPPGGHTGGSNMHWGAVGQFWNSLPPIP